MINMHTEATDRLFKAILSLKNEEECYDFFEDLCTMKELKDMSQRLEVAGLLDRGLNYQAVAAETGVSTATIGRVKRCLDYGTGGYRTALDRMPDSPAEDGK